MLRRIRVGIVGTGFGQYVHAPAFRSDARFELVSIVSARPEKSREAAAALFLDTSHLDWRSMIEDPEIDAVSIAVPPSVQTEMIEAALLRKKHVFCEKPVGGGYAKAKALAQLAKQQSLAHLVDFEFPEIDVWQKAHSLIQAGGIGNIQTIDLSWQNRIHAYRSGLIASWKLDRVRGGGTLNSFASHVFYYLEWLLGPIERLLCTQKEDRVQLSVKWESGIEGGISLSSNCPSILGHRLKIQGAQDALVLENMSQDYVGGFQLSVGSEKIQSAISSSGGDARVAAVSGLVRKFGNWIVAGRISEPSLAEGARVEFLLDQACHSNETKGWVVCKETS